MHKGQLEAQKLRSSEDHTRIDFLPCRPTGYCGRLDHLYTYFLSIKDDDSADWAENQKTAPSSDSRRILIECCMIGQS